MIALFGQFEVPPSMCSLLETYFVGNTGENEVDLTKVCEPGEEDSECDLTANPIFIDPCLDVVPPVVCDETNIDPFLLPPADYCVANPDDIMVL